MKALISKEINIDNKIRVLIVDDTPDNVWFLADAIKDIATIQVALNGETALNMLSKKPLPELVLLDIQMPQMDGYEVCQRIKANPDTAHIPVIFVTASQQGDGQGMEYGASDYIYKPFDPVVARARIQNTVELKRYREHLYETIHNQTRALRKTQVGTIMALADLAEWRDPETGEHILRIQEYVFCIAKSLARFPQYAELLTKEYIEMLHMCAPLHDVGKVSLPDSILLKSGKLSEEEFTIMKKHCDFGSSIIKRSLDRLGKEPFLELAYQLARWHHERWDGEGYPDGISSQTIPLPARIMSVADVYDALRSSRTYKVSFTHSEAVTLIESESGKRFDPDVVKAFLNVEKDIGEISNRVKEANSLNLVNLDL